VIRLGIRVRAVDAEVAYARLEPILAAGAEEVAHGDDIEFAIYGDDVSNERLRALAPEILGISRSPVEPGWETAWHAHLEPVTVGALTIRPPWLPGEGLVVDPGDTFGLAFHPTTRLCLELLQELPPTALADWGCGCGVLSVAAAHLGFDPIVAIELDPGAVATARRNGVNAHVADVTDDPPWARTVVGNLTAALIGNMTEIAAPDGPVTMLVSGVISLYADVPAAVFAPHGFTERERRELDGWAAIILERA